MAPSRMLLYLGVSFEGGSCYGALANLEPSVKTRLDAPLLAKGLPLVGRQRTPTTSLSMQECLPTLDP